MRRTSNLAFQATDPSERKGDFSYVVCAGTAVHAYRPQKAVEILRRDQLVHTFGFRGRLARSCSCYLIVNRAAFWVNSFRCTIRRSLPHNLDKCGWPHWRRCRHCWPPFGYRTPHGESSHHHERCERPRTPYSRSGWDVLERVKVRRPDLRQ